ncbi:hypothetical protein NXS19_013865 [Fusarium pseudograminearum]|nr:hypothetical protein NXS19_013865 [Fusarium pseudograminearum]
MDTAPEPAEEILLPPTPEEAEPPIQHPPVVDELDDMGKDDFYRDLDVWLRLEEKDIKRRWNINGTPVELYDLAQAIQTAPVLPETGTVDWAKVAENLEFADPDIHLLNELQLFYDESLQEFLNSVSAFDTDEEDDDDVDEEPQGEEEHARDEEPVSDSEAIVFEAALSPGINWEDGEDEDEDPPQRYERSSPPVAVSGLKRSADQRELTSPSNAKKRRRYDPDMEIPTTPETDVTPEAVPARDPSPSALASSQWRDYVGESEASQHLPPLPPLVEESQDLGMSVIPQREPLHQSVESPPLENETMDFEPIPLHLNTRQKERPSASKRREPQPKPSRHRDNSSAHETTPRRNIPSVKTASKPVIRSAVRRSLPASFNAPKIQLLRTPNAATTRLETQINPIPKRSKNRYHNTYQMDTHVASL